MAAVAWFLTGGKFARDMEVVMQHLPFRDRLEVRIIDARDVSYLVETGSDTARIWYKGGGDGAAAGGAHRR